MSYSVVSLFNLLYNHTMENKKLFVISGSSGVGKGTVIKELLKRNPELKLSISYTTRKKRKGEVEGINYFYVSKEEFKKSIENNEFLEWAEFSENCYGTKKEFVEKTLAQGKNLILEIDTQGALQLKNKMPQSVLIFISPPSLEDLKTRLRGRNTESEEAISKRLDFVKFEIKNSEKFDHTIVNDRVKQAVEEIEKIIITGN